jgi:hypothetical protein
MADISALPVDVRFDLESGHRSMGSLAEVGH